MELDEEPRFLTLKEMKKLQGILLRQADEKLAFDIERVYSKHEKDKYMKEKFEIRYRPQIESGEYKVVTRDDKQARIVDWNIKGNKPLLVVIDRGNYEEAVLAYKNGKVNGVEEVFKDDLFIMTPEPELTEFEEAVYKCIEGYDPEILDDEDMRDAAREEAKNLFEIARKEMPVWDKNGMDKKELGAFVTGNYLYMGLYKISVSDLYNLLPKKND